jgi:DNA polymerase III epsilon subunit-like protein
MNKIISAPHRRRYYLVFDVETTGLLPKMKRGRSTEANRVGPSIEEYPYILQLSFVIYDLETNTIKKKYDSYVKIAESINIDPYVSNLTGITKQICHDKGKSISTILYDFYKAYKMCEGLVAHNLEFDTKMILVEVERNQANLIEQGLSQCLILFQPMHEKINNIDRYCTMRKGIALCNIMFESGDQGKNSRRKFPKLSELHQKLFNGEIPSNLHNSMVDVEVCLRCYLKMRHNMDTIL